MKKLILMALVCSALYSSATGYFGIKPIVNEPSCNGDNTGSIQLSILGGTAPFQYAWADAGGNPISGNTSTQSSLVGGTYNVTVTDANNQTATYSVVMAQPFPINISMNTVNVGSHGSSNGSVAATADGGTPNYTYLWNNGATTQNIINLPSGTYTVTVTDEVGCTSSQSKVVTQPAGVRSVGVLFNGGNNSPRSLDAGNTDGNDVKESSNMQLPNGAKASSLKAEDVQVFPIPASNLLTLKTGDISNTQITLFDINGQKVSEQIAESNEANVNVSSLPAGNYIVEIKSADGTIVSKRVTVAK